MPSVPAAPRRRSSARIFFPTIALVVVAAVWSGVWAFARAKADDEITKALAREAGKGRVVTCSDRRSGGFPFRIEIRCADPRIVVTRDMGSFTITGANLLAVAQVYRPNHVILEAQGPVTVTPADGGSALEATWTSAEASVVFGLSGPQRASLVVSGLDASETRDGGEAAILAKGVAMQVHARASEDPSAAPGTYDVAATFDAASVPLADAALGDAAPARGQFRGVVTAINDLEPKPVDERLRDWAQAGGVLDVSMARLDRGPTSAMAVGQVALDTDGHPEGKLVVTLAGVDELSAGLRRSGVAPPNLANLLGVGLNLLGKPSNIDGRAAVEIPLTLAKGHAKVGAFPAGPTPTFF